MFDDALRSKVNREIGRLNGELCDLKDAEESLRIRKGRLEVELEQAKAMRGMFELLDRLDRQQQPTMPVVRLEPVFPGQPTGPQFEKPATAPFTSGKVVRRVKPDGLPTIHDMIFTVLESGDELAPRQITERIRQRWWPDLAPDRINTLVSKLKRSGRLGYSDGRYKKLNVNGHARG